jgi:hypothetical protein
MFIVRGGALKSRETTKRHVAASLLLPTASLPPQVQVTNSIVVRSMFSIGILATLMDGWKCNTAAKIKFGARSCFHEVESETVDSLGVRELNYCSGMGSLNQRGLQMQLCHYWVPPDNCSVPVSNSAHARMRTASC